jgi:hypothetical protein
MVNQRFVRLPREAGQRFRDRPGENYVRDSEIDVPFIAPSEPIEATCHFACVVTESFALNEAALTTTSNWLKIVANVSADLAPVS